MFKLTSYGFESFGVFVHTKCECLVGDSWPVRFEIWTRKTLHEPQQEDPIFFNQEIFFGKLLTFTNPHSIKIK